ncbi:recombinase family protein [Dactylosporangium sp. NPDC049140]|uniref:recombinase family protein n=1 Tax=Dactylosporangium sp. NPDC049140 TaxID=3155647 RepID=UPI0033D4980B
MDPELVKRAHWGDFSGMNFAGLVRLSFELPTALAPSADGPTLPLTGRDIRGRDEQAKDCRGYVEHRRGSYVYTYEEPDTSAFKRKAVRLPDGRRVYRVVRPVFEGALEDLKRGVAPNGERLDGLVVYDIDRLTRDNRHLEDAIEVVEHFRRPIVDITGTLDLLTDNGRTVARIVVAANNKQSADTARRVARKHRALQQAGIPAGGWRPFGWKAGKRELEPVEAEAIRVAARRVIGGAPVNAVVAEWNRLGLLTPRGNSWQALTVKTVLRAPRLCGYRARTVRDPDPATGKEHWRYEVVLGQDGRPVVGQWEPILSVAEWDALTAVIGLTSVHNRGVNVRTYLLSGLLKCGKGACGQPLRVVKTAPSRLSRQGAPFTYGCAPSSQGGCGGVNIHGPRTDAAVSELVLRKYELEAERRDAAAEPALWPDEDALAGVRSQIEESTAAWRGRLLSGARYFALLAELEQEEQRLLGERRRWLAREHGVAGRPVDIRARWGSEEVTRVEQRAFIDDQLVAVLVHPRVPGRGKWNPDRLEPLWRS